MINICLATYLEKTQWKWKLTLELSINHSIFHTQKKKNPQNSITIDNSVPSPRCLPGLYLLLKKDQRLSTAKLWRAAARPLSNCGDCCARFSEGLRESSSEKPGQDPAWGSSRELGALFLPRHLGCTHHPACLQSTTEPDGQRPKEPPADSAVRAAKRALRNNFVKPRRPLLDKFEQVHR